MASFDRSGSALAYSTFLGGTGSDVGNAIAVDEKGKAAYVTGSTDSGDFPTTAGARDQSDNGSGDGFVAKLRASTGDDADEDDDRDEDGANTQEHDDD